MTVSRDTRNAPASTGFKFGQAFSTSAARIVPIRAASPCPFCGSLVRTSTWLMFPAEPIVNTVSTSAPFTSEIARDRA